MGDTYSKLLENARLAYEFENCKLFVFYDRNLALLKSHTILYFLGCSYHWSFVVGDRNHNLPVPLNLLPICVSPFVQGWRWARVKMEVPTSGSQQVKSLTLLPLEEESKFNYCRHCLWRTSALEDRSDSVMCKRCARHGTRMSEFRHQQAQLSRGVWLPIAVVCFGMCSLVQRVGEFLFAAVEVAWSHFVALLISYAANDDDAVETDIASTSREEEVWKRYASVFKKMNKKGNASPEEAAVQLEKKTKDTEYGLNQRENLRLMKKIVLQKLLKIDELLPKVDFLRCVMNVDPSFQSAEVALLFQPSVSKRQGGMV